jgi:hypothetical protein
VHPELAGGLCRSKSSLLRRERSALPRSVKPERAGRRLTYKVAFQVSDRHYRVVKARLNVNHALWHEPSLLALEGLFLAGLSLRFCHNPRDA